MCYIRCGCYNPFPRPVTVTVVHHRGASLAATTARAKGRKKKLIGGRYFHKGFEAEKGPIASNVTQPSPIDIEGHGSHTLSTAGGNSVKNVSIFGYAKGVAKGGAPRARVAAYKVCWEDSCYDADILAAFDAGVNDGVDVFSVSLGGSILSEANLDDAISIGSFHAVQRGKVVVASAGNSGPFAATVSNIAPWIINVGASSIDRTFLGTASLGNNKIYSGQSLSDSSLPDRKKYPLVYASNVRGKNASENDGKLCKLGSLDPQKVKGKIVACLRGDNARVEKGEAVRSAGGAGMILLNTQSDGGELLADPHVLPAVHLTAADGEAVLGYINSTKSPIASISAPNTLLNSKPAPVMTAFSSVGPNLIFPDIIKPDITAPGLNILAAWTGASSPTGLDFDHRIVPYNVISGTSMSCPHVAGVSALLKAAFPHWTPAAIRSAIMTSATRIDNSKALIKDSTDQAASPFNFGAGHVRPNGAGNPGLIYDTTVDDYLVFLCSFGYTQKQIIAISGKPFACPKQKQAFYNLNYPSIAVSKINTTIGAVSVKRTVTYVAEGSAVFTSTVKSPRGVIAAVWPTKLQFSKTGEKKSFTVVLKARKDFEKMVNVSSYGYLIWTHGADHVVRSPIVVCKAGTNCLTSS